MGAHYNMSLPIMSVVRMAVQELPLLSFAPTSLVSDGCVFLPTVSDCSAFAGCSITSATLQCDGTLLIKVVPAMLRLIPLKGISSSHGYSSLAAGGSHSEAVALLKGLPTVRLQAVSPVFPLFTPGGCVEYFSATSQQTTATVPVLTNTIREHLRRLRAYVPQHLDELVPSAPSKVSSWFVVSYPGADAVPEPCLFVLPDVLLVRTVMSQVGSRKIPPHHKRSVAVMGQSGVAKLLEELKWSGCAVRVVDDTNHVCVLPPTLTAASQMKQVTH